MSNPDLLSQSQLDASYPLPTDRTKEENTNLCKALEGFFAGALGLNEKKDDHPYELSGLIRKFFSHERLVFAMNAGDGSIVSAFSPAWSFGIEPEAKRSRTRQGRYNAIVGDYPRLTQLFEPFEELLTDTIVVIREDTDLMELAEFLQGTSDPRSRTVFVDHGDNGELLKELPGVFAAISVEGEFVAYFAMKADCTKVHRDGAHPEGYEFPVRHATVDTLDLMSVWVEERRVEAAHDYAREYRTDNHHGSREMVELFRAIHREFGRRYIKDSMEYDLRLYGKGMIQFLASEWVSKALSNLGREDVISRLNNREITFFSQNTGVWDELLILEDKGYIFIDPALKERVAPIIAAALLVSTPLRPLKLQERLAYLSERTEIKCVKSDPERDLEEGKWYRVTQRPEPYAKTFTKQESVKGELMMVKKKREYTREITTIDGRHRFHDDDGEHIQYLLSHFDVPDPGDIRTRYPEMYDAALTHVQAVEDKYLIPRGFAFKEYQKDDVTRVGTKGRAILAHEQGLGKTLEGFAFALAERERTGKELPVLLVAPQDLIPQWTAEVKKFFGIELTHIGRHKGGKPRAVQSSGGEVNISTGAIKNLIEARNLGRELKRNPFNGGAYITHFEALTGGGKNLMVIEEPFTVRIEIEKKWQKPGYRTVDGVRTWFDGGYEEKEKEISSAVECQKCGGPMNGKRACPNRVYNGKAVVNEDLSQEILRMAKPCGHTRVIYKLPTIAQMLSTAFRKGVIVVDEGTQIASARNSTEKTSSLKTKAVAGMKARSRLVMSGTPIKNFIAQAFWLLWWAVGEPPKDVEKAANHRFQYRYNGGRSNFAKDFAVFEWTWNEETDNWAGKSEVGEVTHLSKVWKQFASILLRRVKEQTGELIPPKKIHELHAPLGYYQREQLDFWLQHFPELFAEKHPDDPKVKRGTHVGMAAMLGLDVKLNYTSILPKADPDWEWTGVEVSNWTPGAFKALETVMALVKQGRRVLIGTDVKKASGWIAARLAEKDIRVKTMLGPNGDTVTPPERSKIVEMFQDGTVECISSTQKAIRLGHNLDKGSAVVLFGLDWDYETYAQFRDRVHRLTSVSPVDVYVVIPGAANATIVGRKWEVLNDKAKGASMTLDGELPDKSDEPVDQAQIIRELQEQGMEATGDEIMENTIEEAWEALPRIRDFEIPDGFEEHQAKPWTIDWDAANEAMATYLVEKAERDEADRLALIESIKTGLAWLEPLVEIAAVEALFEFVMAVPVVEEEPVIEVPERPTEEEFSGLPVLDPEVLTPEVPAPLPAPPAFDTSSIIQQLKDLGELHTLGVLTDDEFAEAKTALIAQMKAPTSTNNGAGEPQLSLAL
jgi:hypothetical protein